MHPNPCRIPELSLAAAERQSNFWDAGVACARAGQKTLRRPDAANRVFRSRPVAVGLSLTDAASARSYSRIGRAGQALRLGGGGHPLRELSWVGPEVDAEPRLDQQTPRRQHVPGDLRICRRIIGMLDTLVGGVEFPCPIPGI